MELRKILSPLARTVFPVSLREKVYSETWLKEHVEVATRDHEEALAIKVHPIPYIELSFQVTNKLPVTLQITNAFVELWMGKPVVLYSSFMSEALHPKETREGFRAVTFLNNFQAELLNPPQKTAPPPNLTVIITISCRSSLGTFEKTVKTSWMSPIILPKK